MSRLRIGAGLLAAGLVLGGCTLVPSDVAPRIVPARDVPSGLLTGKPINRSAQVTVTYLDGANQPVAVTSSHEAPVTVRVIVDALAEPPAGYRTAVPATLSVLRGIVHGDRCELTVAGGLSTLPTAQRRLVLMQIGRSLESLFGSPRLMITDASSATTYRWVGSSGR